MSKLYIYNNFSENNAIPKATALLTVKDVDILPNNSITNPRFLVSGYFDAIQYNYCYCEKFKRYYFIKDIIARENDMYELICEVDVLETFKGEILALECIVSRQEQNLNPYLKDEHIISRVGTQTIKKVIGNIGKKVSYVLTVTGGSE